MISRLSRRTAFWVLAALIGQGQSRTLQQLVRQEPGVLTVDLSQWTIVHVTCEGMTLEIPPRVLFDALLENK